MSIDSLIHAFKEKDREIEFIYQTTELTDQKFEHFALHKKRCDLESYVYNYLETTYGAQLTEFWKTHEFPRESKYAWVIVERRCHPNWWFVLRNIAWAGPHMALYIFCSNENLEYLQSLLGDKAKNIHFIIVFDGFANRDSGVAQMCKLMTHPDFYRSINAEYILSFQTDCFFRKRIPDEIFVGDYYGAPWGWQLNDLGGGGVTVRNTQRLTDLCSKEPLPEGVFEDGWISSLVKKYGGAQVPESVRYYTFCENFPTPDPIGVHQFWTFTNNFSINEPEKFKKNIENILKLDL
jgi:hypothetical protein